MAETALRKGIKPPAIRPEIVRSTAPILVSELVDGNNVYLRYLTLPRIPKRRKLLAYDSCGIVNVGNLTALQLPLIFQKDIKPNEILKLDLFQYEIGNLLAALTPDGRFFCHPIDNMSILYNLISCLRTLGNTDPNKHHPEPNPFSNEPFLNHMIFEKGRPVALATIVTHFLSGNNAGHSASGNIDGQRVV